MRFLVPGTIQARLILSHLLVSLVSIALISVYAGFGVFNAAIGQAEQYYENLAFAASNNLELTMQDYLAGEASASEIREVAERSFAKLPNVHYTVYMIDGVPVVHRNHEPPPKADLDANPELADALVNPTGLARVVRANNAGERSIFIAVRVEHGNEIFGILRIDVPMEVALISAYRSLGLLIAIASIVAIGVSVVGYLLARSLSEPVKNMTLTAEKLSKGNLDARVDSSTNLFEMNLLANTLNGMADRLQAQVGELQGFVANASHELRTPLTSIKLRVEALRTGALDDPPVSQQFLTEIESEVDRLSKMVNDMLDLSRIEADLEKRQLESVDLAILVKEVYQSFVARAHKSGLVFLYYVEPGLGTVLGVEDQLRRMLSNLVDNAIKYSPHGGTVRVSLESGAQIETLLLTVMDTGYGIAPAQMERVFERFFRAEATRPRHGPPQGSGLGLSIAKSITETHGGKIGVTSKLGEGSSFWVELPVMQ